MVMIQMLLCPVFYQRVIGKKTDAEKTQTGRNRI